MSAGAEALYDDRAKTATLIGGLTLLAGGNSTEFFSYSAGAGAGQLIATSIGVLLVKGPLI